MGPLVVISGCCGAVPYIGGCWSQAALSPRSHVVCYHQNPVRSWEVWIRFQNFSGWFCTYFPCRKDDVLERTLHLFHHLFCRVQAVGIHYEVQGQFGLPWVPNIFVSTYTTPCEDKEQKEINMRMKIGERQSLNRAWKWCQITAIHQLVFLTAKCEWVSHHK